MNLRKTCLKIGLASLFSLVFSFSFLSPGLIFAQQESPTTDVAETETIYGGDDFDTAEELTLGSYEGSTVPAGESQYFKVTTEFSPGEQLALTGDFEGGTSAEFILYSSDLDKLANKIRYADEVKPLEISWLPGTAENSYTYYFIIKAGHQDDISSYTLDIESKEFFDAGSVQDAGDTSKSPIFLEEGSYTSYVTGELGSDESDFYGVELEKGSVLVVTVTPPPNRSPGAINIYDSGNKQLERAEWPNDGAVVELPFLAKETDEYYIEVVAGFGRREPEPLEYTIDVSVKPLSAAREYFEESEIPDEFSTGGTTETREPNIPSTTDVEEQAGGLIAKFTQGINWALIVGVGVIGIVIGFVLGFLVGKMISGGKKSQSSESVPQSVEPESEE
ncbi:MAG: hypothetical protein ACOC6Q_03110 [Patescibacteria group bacterium]